MKVAPRSISDLVDVEGEQRRVTLMFADISGSTELVRHLEPEETANLLDPAIRVMSESVEQYAGTVSPRGDGILAIFGIPGSAEDNTVRACFAALDMLRRISSLRPGQLRVRIGIHHGEVALLPARRGQPRGYNAFGPAIHIAARLEQTAQPGTACLSAETHALVEDFIDAEPLQPVRVKGLEEPIERALLLGVRTFSRWRARLSRRLTPFVGRQAELASLQQIFDDARTPGLHLLQIRGQAGIGKSRLVHEFLRGEAARSCAVVSLAGPLHRGYAGHDPIAEWLRELAISAAPTHAPDDKQALVDALPGIAGLSADAKNQLSRYLGIAESRRSDLSELVAGPPLSVAEPIAVILAAIAEGRKIIVSCEDAESFEPAAFNLLASLSRELGDRGLTGLLLTSSRVALKLRSACFAGRRMLRLNSLPADAARRLLRQLHPDFRGHPDVAELVLAKSAGNPLYIEEVAALLLKHRGSDDPVEEWTEAIPDRIESLLADRLARMPQGLQALLRVCAVLGAEFSASLLPIVTGDRPEVLEKSLGRLKSERLLEDAADPSRPALAFHHLLLRDVAYKTLLPSKRRSIHARVLEALERQPHAAAPDELCHHAVKARLWPKAVHYLKVAAISAAERAAYGTAERHLRHALEIARQLPQDETTRRTTVEIIIGLRILLALDLRYEEADRLLDHAQTIAGDLDPETRASILIRRIHVLNTLGRLREAGVLAIEAHRAAAATSSTMLQFEAAHFRGQTCFYAGRFHVGDSVLSDDIKRFSATPDSHRLTAGSPAVMLLATRAGIRGFLGHFKQAEADANQALLNATGGGRHYDICFSYLVSGMVQLQRRLLPQAEAAFRSGLENAERFTLKALIPSLHAGLGQTLLLAGSSNAAIAALSEAHETAKDKGRVLIQTWSATSLASAHGSSGGEVSAIRYGEEAVQLGARRTLRGVLVAALRCKGALLAANEATRADGIRCIRQALALARKLDTLPDVAHCMALLARLMPDDADLAGEATRHYARLGMSAWCDRVLAFDTAELCLI
ncbi:MAG: ATP-binding protein [Acetobacteraceae bacterium]